ncbi:S-adenosyl-L-methionine-dependent methyltransferase [Xylariales sp. PMI_506]|nr:S-adenosyl-L-methionine-dependent methyltransferase [Xylariales sp. PMI_506]
MIPAIMSQPSAAEDGSQEATAGSGRVYRALAPAQPAPSSATDAWDFPTHPSQRVESYTTTMPPSHFLAENMPTAADYVVPQSYQPAATATILGRTPSGGSVVEPDSVIGESGRLYHGYKEGRYFLPNDAAEQDRLDLQHEVVRTLFNGWLSLVPFTKPPRYVLDIGTGTGIWASEFAEQNPSSHVIGTDLSAIQPVPREPNCEFIKADVEDTWIYPDPNATHASCAAGGTCEHNIAFDYVHMRFMFTCFNDARNVLQQTFDNLSPGGWLECQETRLKAHQGNPAFKGNAFERWGDACIRGAAAAGRDIDVVTKYKGWLEEIGFVDITERQFLAPFGEWHDNPQLKRVGMYNLQNMLEGLRSIGWNMLRNAGLSPVEVESLVGEVMQEIRDPQSHPYGICYVFCARKPTEAEVGR